MKHIIERAIVPHNPSASSIINKEQYNLYAPVAGQGKVGMAAFDLSDFEVKNQTVFLHANVKKDIATNATNIETNRVNIESEVERATDREAELDAAIKSEVTRATAKEARLDTLISNETTRAKGVESALGTDINNISTRISNHTTAIQKNASDISDLQTVDATNAGNIAINKANIETNKASIEANKANIAINTGDITTNTDNIAKLTKLIADLQLFDTTHEKEFEDFVEKVNDLLDMDDETLDEYHEVLALIKSNKTNLQYLGTTKIDKAKIADDLETALADYVLSANQGVVLKNLITALEDTLSAKIEEVNVPEYVKIGYSDFNTESLAALNLPEGSRIWVSTSNGIGGDVILPSTVRELRLDYDYVQVPGTDHILNVTVPKLLMQYYPCKLTGNYNITLAKGFSEVEGGSQDDGGAAKRYEDCSNIHNLSCLLHDTEFVNCSNISNVIVNLKGTFTNCSRISNLFVGYDSTFTNCSHMGNIAIKHLTGFDLPAGTYTNCTYVDSETCTGYVSTSSGVQIIRWEDSD